jgi:23S rRNA pseudouridine1911/1915/1917 synthase
MAAPSDASGNRRLVDESGEGDRLDRWLQASDLGPSRSQWQRLIEDGAVQVNGESRPSRHRLHAGDEVTFELPEPELSEIEPDPDVQFDILYEDEHIAVIDKPAGLVVHPAPGHRTGTLVNGLLARLDTLSGVGGKARPGLVHRLDKDTSGVLVVARNDQAHRALSSQLEDRSLVRIYRAICFGLPSPPAARIDLPLDRDPRDRKRRAVVEDGRPAVTDYKVESPGKGASLLRLRLRTGRTHQIRVHLAHRGHPVLGDALYGGGENRVEGAHPGHRKYLRAAIAILGRQALHAWELRLIHPSTGSEMRFQSPVPDDLREAWSQLRPEEVHG